MAHLSQVLCKESVAGKEEEISKGTMALYNCPDVSVRISYDLPQVVWLKGENLTAFVLLGSLDRKSLLFSYNYYFLKHIYKGNVLLGQVLISIAVTQLPPNLWDTTALHPNVRYFCWLGLSSPWNGKSMVLQWAWQEGKDSGLRDYILGIHWIIWHTGFSSNFSSYELKWIYLLNW